MYTRAHTLAIVNIMSNFLPARPTLNDIYTYIKNNHQFSMGEKRLKLGNKDLRSICGSMYRKYHTETDHSMYNLFVIEAKRSIDFCQSLNIEIVR